MKKIIILLSLSLFILTGCFDKHTRTDTGSDSDFLEITNFTQEVEGNSSNPPVGVGDAPLGTPILITSSTLIPIDKTVTINFTESLNAQTVNASTVFITDASGTPIAATLTVVDNHINIIPTQFFEPDSRYTIVITTDVKDIQDRSLQGLFNYTFPTASDISNPPSLLNVSPADGTSAPATTDIVLTFSEDVTGNAQVIVSETNANTVVQGRTRFVGSTIRFQPNNALDYSTNYTVRLQGTVNDLDENSYEGSPIWSFTVLPEVDTTAPILEAVTPTDGSVADITTYVSMHFNEMIAGNGTLVVKKSSTNSIVNGTTAIIDNTLRFISQTYLAEGEAYTATLEGTIEDLSGNDYVGQRSWSFTTTPLPVQPPTPDTTAPVITLIGANPQTLEKGSAYRELNATTDDGSPVIIDSSAVDMNTVGTYSVRYNASDALNNQATEVIRTINVVDTTAPVITLTGANPQTLEQGSAYRELNATTDDGSPVIIDSSAVDMNTVGTYSVRYNASDALNNQATEVIRTINVVDSMAPSLLLLAPADGESVTSASVVSITFDEDVTNVGQTLSLMNDITGLSVPGSSTSSGNKLWFIPVNTLVDANYTATIEGDTFDSSHNLYTGQKSWSFTVSSLVDTTPPVITLIGANPQTLEKGSAYIELNATTDDGSPVSIDSSAVDMNTVGTYSVRYNASDASDNPAVEVIRTVIMEDTTAPTLTSLTPTDNQTNVTKSINMTMVFDENIADNNATLEVRDSLANLVNGTNAISANTLNFNPANDLNDSETYTVTVQGTIEDLAGNLYTGVTSWSFTVEDLGDTTPPSVVSFTPADGASTVDIHTDINVTFDENVINDGNVIILRDDTFGTNVPGIEDVTGDTLGFTPNNPLIEDHNYTATIDGTTYDLAGNVYTGQMSWNFKTAPLLDVTAPTLVSFTPTDSAVDADSNTSIEMKFNEDVTNSGLVLKLTDNTTGDTVGSTSGYTGDTLWLIPDNRLTEEHNYTVDMLGATFDLANNQYLGQTSWSFSVKAFEVSRVHHTGRIIGVYFSDKLDPSSVSANDFQIESGTITFQNLIYIDIFNGVLFTADEDLVGDEIISVSGDINDTLGNLVNDGIPMDYSL